VNHSGAERFDEATICVAAASVFATGQGGVDLGQRGGSVERRQQRDGQAGVGRDARADNGRLVGKGATMDRNGCDILAVTTTVGSLADAQALGQAILERRLAACVQIEEGLQSLYRWQGRECQDPEVRLTIKTLPECEAALLALFREKHPYELPQFLGVTMRASEAYHAWVRGEVG
jgi:periplasmic divalent cation tolerance protein